MRHHILIAIDGPAGAGKSTVAKGVAKKLGITYVDTGAMYRAMAWKMLKKGIGIGDIAKLAKSTKLSMKNEILYLDGSRMGEEIRTQEVSTLSSEIATIPEVRYFLVKKQREIASEQSVVMDGRDVGTYVLPHANVKIFLTASIEQRALRRYEELKQKGMEVNIITLQEEISKRDYMDSTREVSPLKQAKDAFLIDTTDKTVEAVIELICRYSSGIH